MSHWLRAKNVTAAKMRAAVNHFLSLFAVTGVVRKHMENILLLISESLFSYFYTLFCFLMNNMEHFARQSVTYTDDYKSHSLHLKIMM